MLIDASRVDTSVPGHLVDLAARRAVRVRGRRRLRTRVTPLCASMGCGVRMSASVTRLIWATESQGKLIAACALRGYRRVWRFRTCRAGEFEGGQGHPRALRIAQRTVPQSAPVPENGRPRCDRRRNDTVRYRQKYC